jgi:hypothetical protein
MAEADGLMTTVEIARDASFRDQDPVGLFGLFRKL